MKDDGLFYGGMLTGGFIVVVVMVTAMILSGMRDNQAFMLDHPNLEDRMEQERRECEERPNVVECVWDSSELEYVKE